MRREGFELTVGKPQVVTKEVNGKLHEPVEPPTIDAPEEYLGTITELLAARRGRMEQMTNHGTGWVRMEFLARSAASSASSAPSSSPTPAAPASPTTSPRATSRGPRKTAAAATARWRPTARALRRRTP